MKPSDAAWIAVCVTLADVIWQVTKLIFELAWMIIVVVLETVMETFISNVVPSR